MGHICRMKVEDWWWPGYTTTTLRPGKIVHVNFTNDNGRFFLLQLDNELFTYPMRYAAVLKYVNKDDANSSNHETMSPSFFLSILL